MSQVWLVTLAVAVTLGGGRKQAGAGDELPAFTPQREAAALEFVEAHHPELKAVLGRLERLHREQYEQAIRELFDKAELLAHVKANDEQRYELMLEAWKVQSRAEVVAARIACAKEKNEALENELKRLLRERVELERRQVEHRRKRLLELLAATEKSLKWFEENREVLVERRFRALTRADRSPKAAAAKAGAGKQASSEKESDAGGEKP